MSRMCEIAFGQLSEMAGDKPRNTKGFFQLGYTHLILCVINIAEDGDKFVPISGRLLLGEGEMGSDCRLLSSS